MNTKPDIAVLSFSDIQRDGRVLRQIEYLSRNFSVIAIGYGNLSETSGVFSQIKHTPRWLRRCIKTLTLPLCRLLPAFYDRAYFMETDHRVALSLLERACPDFIHANDWDALPVAIKASQKTGALIILDLHEYSPRLRENHFYWEMFYAPMIDYFLHKYGSQVAASITVSPGLAKEYKAHYNLTPDIIMNVPPLQKGIAFRATDPQHIHIIHHGAAIRDRQLEIMIQALSYTAARYELHFMLVEHTPSYIQELKGLAQKLVPGRITFHQPVSPLEIVKYISRFDMGFFPLPQTNFSYAHALPNKFFDFVAAGLAVCVGPSLEMSRLVHQYGFGVVTPSLDPAAIAETLNSLTTDVIDTMKRAALQAAKVLNADVEMQKLLELYQGIQR